MARQSKQVEEGKVFAFLSMFLTIVGFTIVLLTKKDNKYAMFYAKQGLLLFIGYIVAIVSGAVFSFIPFIGKVINFSLWVIIVVLWIMGMIHSLSGEEKDLPIIGELARRINV